MKKIIGVLIPVVLFSYGCGNIFVPINNINADPGDVVASFNSPGTHPTGLTWDGYYLWNADDWEDVIYKLDPSDGSIVDSFSSPGGRPWGLTWDGYYLWNADDDQEKIYKLDPSDGSIVDSFSSPGYNYVDWLKGLAWDGYYLWSVDDWDEVIYKLDPSSGKVKSSFNSPGPWPRGLTWDGTYLWNADEVDGRIYKLDSSDGGIVDSFNSPGDGPTGLTWDGNYLWNADHWEDKIYKIDIGLSNYPPDMPTIVRGEAFGVVNHYYQYLVTTTDPDNDRVKYCFDWGDEIGGWTVLYDSGDKGRDDHTWREPGVYEVRAKAMDEKGAEGYWSKSLMITIREEENNPPNKPSTPSGPTAGRAGVRYTYCTCATDPDEDQIAYYLWDWGDGGDKRTTTYGPFDSGETVCENHTWQSRDRYEVKVWAVDVYGAHSYPSDPLIVSMPKLKLVNLFQFNSLQKLIEDSLLLKWFLWFSSFEKTTLSQVTK